MSATRPVMPRARLGILVSGRGSNMEALADAVARGEIDADVAIVVSNVADAPAIERARARGLDVATIPHRGVAREDHERLVNDALVRSGTTLACLAGYMRLFTPAFTAEWRERMLNVHPSLLPSFPGVDAQAQALAHGVKVSGCTVHFVDEHLDHGPIVLQSPVPVEDGDTVETLSRRILEAEHATYPRAVALVASGRVRVVGRSVHRA